jgi:Choline/ethanolamine kinase
MSDLAAALARIPLLAGTDPASATRLAGLTNVNYLFTVPSEGTGSEGRFVVRIPGEGTSEYIDRVAEHTAALGAADSGVNAPVVFFDPADGLMVTRFIDGAATMSAARFLFGMIDEYRQLLTAKSATLPDGYEALQAEADATRAALQATARPLVPAHCDPLCENFLDTGERMFVIDYEYAGNNDPMWDLGDLSVEGGFTSQQDAALLEAYFGGAPPLAEVSRMVAYQAMCDLLWTLWGVIQHVNGNPADDFWAYATGRFERCRTLMSDPSYHAHLHRIVAG